MKINDTLNMPLKGRFLSALLIFSMFGPAAFALPENSINSRDGDKVLRLIQQTHGNIALLKSELTQSGIPQLDDLWNNREPDFVDGKCDGQQNNCRYVSVFRCINTPGQKCVLHTEHPVVLLPGFTGYRKMYLEQIYDLLQAGYGPIYISDFAGTGDSYKPELKPGQKESTVDQFLQMPTQAVLGVDHQLTKKIVTIAGKGRAPFMRKAIGQLPVGIGYIDDFRKYNYDVNLIMDLAVKENPSAPILVTALSMSGLSLVLAIADQDAYPTWISHVSSIVLESPMIRVVATGQGKITEAATGLAEMALGPKFPVGATASIPEYADKALGHYNSFNLISHSKYRLPMTDSMRVWNGHETVGATFGWAYTELMHQYSKGPADSLSSADPLNNHVQAIRNVLSRYKIPLVDVSSLDDHVVDTSATKLFLSDIKDGNNIYLCLFKDARHVIDQESDFYREPYMALLLDQQTKTVRKSYGTAPRNQVLNCQELR